MEKKRLRTGTIDSNFTAEQKKPLYQRQYSDSNNSLLLGVNQNPDEMGTSDYGSFALKKDGM